MKNRFFLVNKEIKNNARNQNTRPSELRPPNVCLCFESKKRMDKINWFVCRFFSFWSRSLSAVSSVLSFFANDPLFLEISSLKSLVHIKVVRLCCSVQLNASSPPSVEVGKFLNIGESTIECY